MDITGLARSTVTSRVDALLATGLLVPASGRLSSGGRPASPVTVNHSVRMALGVDLGATHGVVGISDLAGNVLASVRDDVDIADGPVRILDWAIERGSELLKSLGIDSRDLAGIGIGVPGPVEHTTGRAIKPQIMPGWDQFDIPGYINKKFATPVFVDNDVNLLALGEHAKVWPDLDDLLFVKVSTGIGAGIVSGGILQRGAQGTAGDIGHVQVPRSHDTKRPLSDHRDLEAIASGPAIASSLAQLGTEASSAEDVARLLYANHPEATQLTRQAGREVGEVIATIVNLLNPSVIVIGGSIARAGEDLLAGIKEVVYRRSTPLATQQLQIVPSAGGDLAGVYGAAIMVSQRFFLPASLDTWIASQFQPVEPPPISSLKRQ